MMKEEFESMIGREVSETEYKEIEYVYTWHPAVGNTEGKEQIAAIFNAGGMVVIRSMKEASAMAEALDKELRAEMRKIERLKTRIQKLENGDTGYERCLKDAKIAFDIAETLEQLEKLFGNMEKEYGVEMVAEVRQTLNV